ncbi:MAG: ferredoxin [Betaproteobacteria bacterium]
MYVILTSKPGQFRTELAEGLDPVEAYDYLFCGRKRAGFVIAELKREVKVKIVDESCAAAVNFVPSKFLPRFDSLQQARRELEQLVAFGDMDMRLVRL